MSSSRKIQKRICNVQIVIYFNMENKSKILNYGFHFKIKYHGAGKCLIFDKFIYLKYEVL